MKRFGTKTLRPLFIKVNRAGNVNLVRPAIRLDTNLKTGPSCGWIGGNRSLKFYCFAVFTDERIHRIEQRDDRWSDWMLMPSEKIFIQRPIFLTSREANDISIAQR